MRLRTAVLIFAALNVLWAAAFFGYTHRSRTPVVRESGEANVASAVTGVPPARVAASTRTNAAGTNTLAVASANRVAAVVTNNPSARTNRAEISASPAPSPAGRQFGWQDVTNAVYQQYIANLRAVGCPEKQVRNIIVSDVNELFDKRRLEYAIKTDSQWWKAETFMGVLPMQTMVTANLDEQRRDLLEQLIGKDWEQSFKVPSLNGGSVNLTGPVLGALPAETYNSVQEICARSMERHNAYMMARMNEGGQMDPTEMARMRDQTRTGLAKILTAEELEEFLLRYSHNASKLRQDMRGLDLSPDEFRKIFRAIDPVEHQLQLDYGGVEALSQKQREQFEAQRDRVIQETLSPAKYQQYLVTKDPLYRQAQLTAFQYGMNAKAIQPLYQLQKNIEAKRLQITQNAALTPAQKAQALQSVGIEHQQMLQRMMGDLTYRQ